MQHQTAQSQESTVSDFILRKYERQLESDEKARNEPALRLVSGEFIVAVGELLENFGARLARERYGSEADAFDDDAASEDILWQLAEYLIGGVLIERGDDIYDNLRNPFEFTTRHAAAYFKLNTEFVQIKSIPSSDEQLVIPPDEPAIIAG